MTALQKSGFYWFHTNCRYDSIPSQRKTLSNSSPPKPLPLAPLPYIIIIPLHLHPTYLNNPLILDLHRTPHHLTHHPKPYPSHPPNSPTVPNIPTIPTRLSPVTTKGHNLSLP